MNTWRLFSPLLLRNRQWFPKRTSILFTPRPIPSQPPIASTFFLTKRFQGSEHNRPQKSVSAQAKNPTKKRKMKPAHVYLSESESNETEKNDGIIFAICNAESYNLQRIYENVQSMFPHTILHPETIHVRYSINSQIESEVFIFEQGCIVVWSSFENSEEILTLFKDAVQDYSQKKLSPADIEEENLYFSYIHADRFSAKIYNDTLVLQGSSNLDQSQFIKAKIAFSRGISNSVRLAVKEKALEATIERMQSLHTTLGYKVKKSNVTRSELLQLTGKLLAIRADLNFDSGLLDPPEEYWSEPELENYFLSMCKELDISRRVQSMNDKLDYGKEIADAVNQHLSEKHGLMLEWIIIILIAAEVVLETIHFLR